MSGIQARFLHIRRGQSAALAAREFLKSVEDWKREDNNNNNKRTDKSQMNDS